MSTIELSSSAHHGRQPIQYIPAVFGGPQDKTELTYTDLGPATLFTFGLPAAEEAAVRKLVSFLRAAGSLQGAETPLMEQSARSATTYIASQITSANSQNYSPGSPSLVAGTHENSSELIENARRWFGRPR